MFGKRYRFNAINRIELHTEALLFTIQNNLTGTQSLLRIAKRGADLDDGKFASGFPRARVLKSFAREEGNLLRSHLSRSTLWYDFARLLWLRASTLKCLGQAEADRPFRFVRKYFVGVEGVHDLRQNMYQKPLTLSSLFKTYNRKYIGRSMGYF